MPCPVAGSADGQHHRNFDKHANHRGERRSRLRAEKGNGCCDGQFEEIGSPDESAWRSNAMFDFQEFREAVSQPGVEIDLKGDRGCPELPFIAATRRGRISAPSGNDPFRECASLAITLMMIVLLLLLFVGSSTSTMTNMMMLLMMLMIMLSSAKWSTRSSTTMVMKTAVSDGGGGGGAGGAGGAGAAAAAAMLLACDGSFQIVVLERRRHAVHLRLADAELSRFLAPGRNSLTDVMRERTCILCGEPEI